MRLTQVSVEGCGRFGNLTTVEGFGPGVNILSARNEAGKSTLFRAIRTCLFERHSSTNKDIAALATDGLSLPVTITVGFEKDGQSYEIRKSFLKNKSASFTCGGVERARNAEADEEVWKLLGIEPKSTRALDEAAYGILWVEQGRSFEAPEPSEAAKGVLNSVIQQEVGTLVGGERARLLLNAVKEEISRYYTDSGRVKTGGPLESAAKERSSLTDERLDVEARLSALDQKLSQIASLRADHKAASDPAVIHAFTTQLSEAREKLAAAEKAGEDVKRLAGEERQAHLLLETQQEKLDRLVACATDIDEKRLRLKELLAKLAPLDEQEAATTRALGEANEEKASRDRDIDALERHDAEQQRLEALAARLNRRAEMERRLVLLQDIRNRAAASEAALSAASVDDAAIRTLDGIEREEAKHRAALEAGAARLAIAMAPGADVRMNGAAIADHITRSVTEPLTIKVGDSVSITVSPAAEALGSSAAKALQAERDKLQKLLSHHGAASPAELRQRRTARMALEEQARELRAERLAQGIPDDLASEIEALQAAVTAIAVEARHLLPAGDAALPPPEAFAEARQGIAERRGELRGALAACNARITAHTDALRKLAATRGQISGQAEALHIQIESALAFLPDAQRHNMTEACANDLSARREAHRIKAATLAERQSRAPAPEEAERLASRIERLSAALKTQSDDVNRLREAIARLEGEVQNAGGEGLGERVATLKIQQEMAAAEETRLIERAEVLKLLRDTVDRCYAERREQLNAPLQRHLKPFLNDVFPEAQIALGENFAISGLSRSRPEGELFGRLSLGTQEQVAVLVRLAMGAMIAERGTDVPVILDDALVFSDDARIEQMFDALNRAGKNQQVIVLTCRARSFASLGGRQLRIS